MAILVPVLDRPHRIEPLLASIAEATEHNYSVVFAASDQPTIDVLERVGARYIVDEGGTEGTYPKRINRLFRETTEPFVLLAADDLSFRSNWFPNAMRLMETLDGVVGINDLHSLQGVHFLVSRNYVDTLGGCVGEPGVVLHEGYLHCYCDDELRNTAISRGRWGYAGDAVIEHLHAAFNKAPRDATYDKGNASMSQGFQVFSSRTHLWQGE